MMRRLAFFLADCKGSVAAEMALFVPLLLILMFGGLEAVISCGASMRC